MNVPAGGFRERPRKVFLWRYTDFSTSIYFIADIISSKSRGVFELVRQVKSEGGFPVLAEITCRQFFQ